METISNLLEGRLVENDLPQAELLVRDAGWNQVTDDWRVFIDLGTTFALRSSTNRLVATAAVLPYPAGFSWISMVLVQESWRHRGIATHLLRKCIDSINSDQSIPVLDATEAGRAVYTPLGFVDEWSIERWYRPASGSVSNRSSTDICPIAETEWTSVIAFDEAAFGSSRLRLLERLSMRSRNFSCVAKDRNGIIEGFLLGRNGRMGTQLGPIVGNDEAIACALVSYACAMVHSALFIDVPRQHRAFSHWLHSHGFILQRAFTRMSTIGGVQYGNARQIMAIAGPEFG
jgi:GNAT superfamily N-acetyltransferase